MLYRVRANISGQSGGTEVNTTYWDATSPQTAQDAADAARVFWDGVKSLMHTSYTVTIDPLVYTIDPATGSPTAVTGVTDTPVVGTNSGATAPPSSQGLLRLHTGVFPAGREIVGRVFVPGVIGADVTAGAPSSGYQTVLNAAAASAIAWTNSTWMVYSRENHTAAVVTSAKAWSKFAVLRSRRD